jgi:hypothetical protein
VIVYLEREEDAFSWPQPAARTLYDDEAEDVGHELIVVAQSGTVRFASRGGVEHRLFAVRGRERIDVGVPAEGRSQRVRLVTPGLARFYCSLHEEETRDVFVVPSSLFARLDPKGAYHIAHVPPGDYRLRIWSQPVEGTVKAIRVGLWTSAQETIWLDPARISR